MNNYPMPAGLREESIAYLKQEPEQVAGDWGKRFSGIVLCGALAAGALGLARHNAEPVYADTPVITLDEARAAGMFDSFRLDGDDTTTSMGVTTTAKATSTTEMATSTTTKATPTSEAATKTTEVDLKFVQPDVIGEKPCGPEINPAEVKWRHAAGEIVIKPSKTAEFLDLNPIVEQGLNDFWKKASNGDTRWMTAIADMKAVTNKDIIEGKADEGVRGLKARMIAGVLVENLDVQNHNCNLETGEIFANDGRNGHNNHLVKGDQVWTIDLSKQEREKMAELGIALPGSLLTFEAANGALTIILERIACNNPLLELPPPPTPESTTTLPTTTLETTTTVTVPPSSTTSTIPESSTTTTSTPTTVPNSTSTSSPTTSTSTTTTMPATTTTQPKGTVPPTTGCSEYNPCGTTTVPESTSTSTTSTIPEITTTSTVPETTTTTSSIPGATTTSTTTTTMPATTTTQPKGTVPPTTGCSEFNPCGTTTTTGI